MLLPLPKKNGDWVSECEVQDSRLSKFIYI